MMQMMQQAQQCMADIDMSKLEGLAKEGKQVEARMRKLCADGDESGALEVGMAFSKKMRSQKELAQMRKCSEKMRGMLPPQMSTMIDQLSRQQDAPKDQGICSGF